MPLDLNIEPRTRIGSREARRLRREGMIPGILYGRGGEVAIKVNEHHFMTTVGYGTSTGIIRLSMPGEKPVSSIVKEVQWNPVSERPVHIDFLRVLPSQIVTVPVPVHLEGSPQGVLMGGILDHNLHEVSVTVKAADIPGHVSLDVSRLGIGDAVHISDFDLPKGMTIDMPPDQVVASVITPRVLKTTETAEEAVESEETGPAEEE